MNVGNFVLIKKKKIKIIPFVDDKSKKKSNIKNFIMVSMMGVGKKIKK